MKEHLTADIAIDTCEEVTVEPQFTLFPTQGHCGLILKIPVPEHQTFHTVNPQYRQEESPTFTSEGRPEDGPTQL